MADILRMAREQVAADPNTQSAMAAASQGAMQQAQQQQTQALVGAVLPALTGAEPGAGAPGPAAPAAPPIDPQAAGQAGAQAAFEQLVKQKATEIMAPHKQRAAEAKQFGETLESVIAYMWSKGKLKAAAEPQVGSAFTCGPGWIKVTWQESSGLSQITTQQIDDLNGQLSKLAANQVALAQDQVADVDAKKAEIQNQLAGLSSQVEVLTRGLAIDFVAAEDVTVSTEVPSIPNDYKNASWIDHRIFLTMEDARAKFPELSGDGDDDKLKKATHYFKRKPVETEANDIGKASTLTENDADQYTTGTNGGATTDIEESSVCVHETQSKTLNQIITTIEGIDTYARKPYAPDPQTSRFYSLFLYSPTKVDGERHPQSMILRTQDLLEDMSRLYSNRSLHRSRCIPKTAFNKRNMDPKDAAALEGATTGEMVGIDLVDPQADIRTALTPVAYAQIDQALYDDSQTRAELERAWGIQEALSSSIQTAKTATEAEIQKTGTEARTGYMRDCLDEMFNDLAEYTAEIALQKLEKDDAIRIAGPFAFWPDQLDVSDLSTLVLVQIRAGSSGKPNTAAQRQAWATTAPLVQQQILQIGQMRGASPESIADCLEELASETLRLQGDKLDPSRFFPTAPDGNAMPQMPAPGAPMAGPTPTPAPVPQPPGAM
jgi:hypothetical protein